MSGLNQFTWTPGIGDPTLAGWVTVLLYAAAAVNCWLVTRRLGRAPEARTWLLISILFILLGFNKQLDLQSALTEVGRILSLSEGWYGDRRRVQAIFIAIVAAVCVLFVGMLLLSVRRVPIPTWVAIIGTVVVIGYVFIRAASFHHIDRFIGRSVLGFRWNWVLEMGGITIVLLASARRLYVMLRSQ